MTKVMDHLKGRALALSLAVPLAFAAPTVLYAAPSAADDNEVVQQQPSIVKVQQINPTTIEVLMSNHQRMTFDFYGENIFRVFQDNNGGILRDPAASPHAQILVDQPRRRVAQLRIREFGNTIEIATEKVALQLDKDSALFRVINLQNGKTVIEQAAPTQFEKKRVTMTLKGRTDEYFYGGGVQNGRFSHKGKAIWIENQNSWTDGGVASPTPYYWSTEGYAMMWYSFKKGQYDFGAAKADEVRLFHETDYLDLFFMVNDGMVPLLRDFYQLTGNPVLLPKFGFYEGHLNAYNRDYWKEDENGILFEDGKRYKESQKDNGGVKESLNGEKENYQFSARAVIDRYKRHNMPLGWILPNDGYGAGYGQTETLDGNIQNLKSFGDYARENGVEVGLWTQSDLHPKPEVSALLQRDIIKEVRDAGVRVLKTDVAWVGAGYSFGLNGVADVGHIMPYYGNDSRPFIISLDGWAGTQRYATIWSGDQTGGKWEYIRFHIPTYIGSGLSGQPNITSDMDGIFGGKDAVINTRDFQWKMFTPMQLNMDGWGANEKYPHALGEPATSINRWYLKMKSELLPYSYSIAREAVDGLPIMRAMFLEESNPYTLGKATQYQFMYGPSFLVAPIYQATAADKEGNDIRNGIYLPQGRWIDYFSGEIHEGGRILNNYAAPLWKLPVFVKAGAIIPMNNPNNNVSEIDRTHRIYEVYPYGESSFTEYDDDGVTEAYRNGECSQTRLSSKLDEKGRLTFRIDPTEGHYAGMPVERSTELRIKLTAQPRKVAAVIGGRKVKLSLIGKDDTATGYYFDEAPELNRFATEGSEFARQSIKGIPQLVIRLPKADVTAEEVVVTVEGCEYAPAEQLLVSEGHLTAPRVTLPEENIEAYTLRPTWEKVEHADCYEIEFEGMLYSTIRDNSLLFEDLKAETDYTFKVRAVNKEGHSEWTTLRAKTKSNPLEFALEGLTAENSAKDQGGRGVNRLFDFSEKNLWHTKYRETAVPFELDIDLHTVNQLDKLHYLPREEAGNGTFLKGKVFHSMDNENWTEAGTFEWQRDNTVKVFEFKTKPTARYVKIAVSEAVGNYGSGREIYIFKVPGTESFLPGDINHDRLLDMNDFTSYMNYTGLRQGDADFEGYVSNGDMNRNGLIDAYDISVAATRIRGGADLKEKTQVGGQITLSADKRSYRRGEEIRVTVSGTALQAVNALSFALPYDQQMYEFTGVEPIGMKQMENLTNDRLHTNGDKALYPTFVNIGEKETLNGDGELFILKFKARQPLDFDLRAQDGMLVDKHLRTHRF